MLADQWDYVLGVDPHREWHALAVVDVRSGAVVFEANVAANGDGYRQALVPSRATHVPSSPFRLLPGWG
jgi:hypothetical protein